MMEQNNNNNNPNDSIAKDGQYTETSPGDLRSLAVTQIPVKNHQFMLMWKTLEEEIIIRRKVGDWGLGWPEGSLFNSYNTEV